MGPLLSNFFVSSRYVFLKLHPLFDKNAPFLTIQAYTEIYQTNLNEHIKVDGNLHRFLNMRFIPRMQEI